LLTLESTHISATCDFTGTDSTESTSRPNTQLITSIMQPKPSSITAFIVVGTTSSVVIILVLVLLIILILVYKKYFAKKIEQPTSTNLQVKGNYSEETIPFYDKVVRDSPSLKEDQVKIGVVPIYSVVNEHFIDNKSKEETINCNEVKFNERKVICNQDPDDNIEHTGISSLYATVDKSDKREKEMNDKSKGMSLYHSTISDNEDPKRKSEDINVSSLYAIVDKNAKRKKESVSNSFAVHKNKELSLGYSAVNSKEDSDRSQDQVLEVSNLYAEVDKSSKRKKKTKVSHPCATPDDENEDKRE